jgi:N-acyl homoserine lactone hydrolase
MELPEPRPAQLPLPGGRAGATVRVHPLRTAQMKAMPDFYARPSGPLATLRGLGLHVPRSRWLWVPIPAFLVEHPEAGPILIDTGLHELAAHDVGAALGRLGKLLFTIDMQPGWGVPAQLRERGVDPADVRLIVMTHLHYDHASGLSQFPQATVVADAAEWEAAAKQGMRGGYQRSLLPATMTWRTTDASVGEVDLLGDGSIVLLSTAGHSPGHRSVVLRLAGGRELLLTADAAYSRRTIDEDLLPLLTWDDARFRDSVARLRAWIAAHPGAEVVCGHDAERWDAVPRLFE